MNVDALAEDDVLDVPIPAEFIELLEGMHDDEISQTIKRDKVMRLAGFHHYREKKKVLIYFGNGHRRKVLDLLIYMILVYKHFWTHPGGPIKSLPLIVS